jgi:hypothetical protein
MMNASMTLTKQTPNNTILISTTSIIRIDHQRKKRRFYRSLEMADLASSWHLLRDFCVRFAGNFKVKTKRKTDI